MPTKTAEVTKTLQKDNDTLIIQARCPYCEWINETEETITKLKGVRIRLTCYRPDCGKDFMIKMPKEDVYAAFDQGKIWNF